MTMVKAHGLTCLNICCPIYSKQMPL